MQVDSHRKATLLAALSLAWLATGAVSAKEFVPTRAKAIYKANCAVCHGEDGSGKTIGDNRFPAIAGLPKWYVEDQLIKFKYDGRGADHRDKEGLMMHAMVRVLRTRKVVVNEKEIDHEIDIEHIAAYIGNELKPKVRKKGTVKGNIENGRKIYTTAGVFGCIRCHGETFQGRDREDLAQQIPRTPPLWNLDDWYLLLQLEKFRGGIRGAPAKTTNARKLEQVRKEFTERQGFKVNLPGAPLMAAMSQTAFALAPDPEQAMRDVAAYIHAEARKNHAEKSP